MSYEQLNTILNDATDLKNYWKDRNDKLLEVRKLINLIRPPRKTDESNWITNEPKVFFDTSRALVSINDPRFRLPIPMNFSPDEKEKMNKTERFIIGIWRSLNQTVIDRGGVSWLWDLAYWVLMGWYAVFSVVRKHPITGEIQFIGDIYDPMTVYPQWDTEGLIKCVRSYEVSKTTAISMAENLIKQLSSDGKFVEPTGEGRVDIINWWDMRIVKKEPLVRNAIVINGQLIKPPTKQSKLRRIPIHVGAIGAPDVLFDNWMTRKGEAITDADTDMYEYTNVMIKLLSEILAETAYPNIISSTRTGQGVTKGRGLKGHGEEIPIRIGDKIELLRHAASPPEVQALLDYFHTQVQKGSIPNVVYGGLNVELSGFAISQLMAAIKYKLSPYLNALQAIVSRVMEDFLFQYKQGRYPKITLATDNPHALRRGESYIEEYSPDDIPERIFVETAIPITSQFDKTQTILNGIQGIQNGAFSRETFWETSPELGIEDAEQEKERIREDQLFNDPFLTDIEIVERMWQRIEAYQAQGKKPQAEALKRYVMQKEMSLGMRQGIPQKPNVGVPPNQMPPEMTQSPNPDQKRAMMNQPPPSPNRKKPTIFSANGERLA